MNAYLQGLAAQLGAFLPNLLAALVILIVGWIIAIVVSAAVRALLRRTTLDDRLARMLSGSESPRPDQIKVESWITGAIFWLIIFITVVVFLQTLNLTAISGPLGTLLTQILAFIPGLISAIILLLIAWVIASVLRLVITRLFNASGLSRRLSDQAEVRPQDRVTIGKTLGNIVYWLVFLFFLPAILNALNLQGLLAPVQGVVNEILAMLPNILAAVLILAVGWLVARIVRQVVTNLLAGFGIDKLTTQAGLPASAQQIRLSEVIGTIVYVLILIPVAIAALNALNIPAISGPASAMLANVLNALPAIFGALILIAIAYFAGRILGRFVSSILATLGFDRLFAQLGLFTGSGASTPVGREAYDASYMRRGPAEVFLPLTGTAAETAGPIPGAMLPTRTTPAMIVGYIVTVAILLFAIMEAADLMGFDFLAQLVSRFIAAGTQVLVGLVIFGVGLYISRWVERIIRDSNAAQANILAPAARIAIIVFSAALALREMGIAESIVNLAFGLLLGAVAVAAALAFGLGGRDVAARQLERWQQTLRAREAIDRTTRPMDNTDATNRPSGMD
jgi:hypothetical protein